MRGSGDVEVDVEVEEVEVDSTPSPPAAGEPVALVFEIEAVEETEAKR